jgi:hypothetical protein
MRIDITQKEFKNDKLELSSITFFYLLAVKSKHPNIWEQLKQFINQVDTKELNELQ